MDDYKKYNWHKIQETEEELLSSPNNILEITVSEKKICLAKTTNGLYAFSAICPHAGGAMVNGFIDALGNIVCPLHRYKFNLQTGRDTQGEGYQLKTYPLKIIDKEIFIGIKKSGLFG